MTESVESLEAWLWGTACSIRGAKDAPKFNAYILPLVFPKRLCDGFDDEIDRIAQVVGSRVKAFKLVKADKTATRGSALPESEGTLQVVSEAKDNRVRFYLPLLPDDPEQPVWSVIRRLSSKIGEDVTSHMRAVAREDPLLPGIIDRVDFSATTHGQRDLDDDRLSNLIEAISTRILKQLGVGA